MISRLPIKGISSRRVNALECTIINACLFADYWMITNRFDGRGHFTARELVMYDASSRFEPLSRSDSHLEEELDRERFADLAPAEEAELQGK